MDLAIIGGGLAGLAAAAEAERAGLDWRLFEARDRVGGRAFSPSGYDLGPAWIWPQNRRMRVMAAAHGIALHEQHAEGRLVFEDRSGAVRRDLDITPMAGALRLDGGVGRLAEAMAGGLPSARLHLCTPVTEIDAGPTVMAKGEAMSARHVLLALPPRVIAAHIALPENIESTLESLASVPTWMAAHAKLVAVYDRPFWRDAGLSGSAISHRGPLQEIHDASPADGMTGALFGFIGVPYAIRAEQGEALKQASIAQLAHLFGPEAAAATDVILQDWAGEPETATDADHDAPAGHPAYGPLRSQPLLASHGFFLAGSEVAPGDGGFLEGALEAAEIAMAAIRAPEVAK